MLRGRIWCALGQETSRSSFRGFEDDTQKLLSVEITLPSQLRNDEAEIPVSRHSVSTSAPPRRLRRRKVLQTMHIQTIYGCDTTLCGVTWQKESNDIRLIVRLQLMNEHRQPLSVLEAVGVITGSGVSG